MRTATADALLLRHEPHVGRDGAIGAEIFSIGMALVLHAIKVGYPFCRRGGSVKDRYQG